MSRAFAAIGGIGVGLAVGALLIGDYALSAGLCFLALGMFAASELEETVE